MINRLAFSCNVFISFYYNSRPSLKKIILKENITAMSQSNLLDADEFIFTMEIAVKIYHRPLKS